MKTKKLNKRVLAWLMTVMMCMSGFQVSVFATDESLDGGSPDTTVTETVDSSSNQDGSETETGSGDVTPAEPTESEQPTAPVTPTEPTEPEQPIAPVTPAEPTEPEQPIAPVTPAEPTEPEQPTTPVTPTEPVEPEQPTTPVTPTEPTEPEQPTAPVTPSDPETQEPTVPAEPPKDGEAVTDPKVEPPTVNGGGDGTAATPDEIAKAENDLKDANANVEKIEGEKADADGKLQEAQAAADKAAEALNQAITRANSAETAFLAAQTALANAVTDEEKAQAQSALDSAQAELDSAKAQLASAQSAVEDAEQLLKEAGLAAEDAAARFEEAKKAADDLKAKLDALKAEQPKEETAADYNSALKQIPEQITSENISGEVNDKVLKTYGYFAEMDEEAQKNIVSDENDRFKSIMMSTVNAYRNMQNLEEKAVAAEKFNAFDINIDKLVETDNALNDVIDTEITADNILDISGRLVESADSFVKLTTPLKLLWQSKGLDACDTVREANERLSNNVSASKSAPKKARRMQVMSDVISNDQIAYDEKTYTDVEEDAKYSEQQFLMAFFSLEAPVVQIEKFDDLINPEKKATNQLENGTYQLISNVAVTAVIQVTTNFTLDLNGFTISYDDSYRTDNTIGGNMFEVSGNANFTIKDSSENKTGTLQGITGTPGQGGNSGSLVYVKDNATFTLESGTITGNHKGTPFSNSGLLFDYQTLSNGTYTIHSNYKSKDYSGAGVYIESGTFKMTGGTISDNHTIYCDSGKWPENTQYTKNDEDNYNISDNNIFRGYYVFNPAYGKEYFVYKHPAGQGGGVYVNSGTFKMSGGIIKGNHAGEGGGVFIYSDKKAVFEMTGGIIGDENEGNIAHLGEGGGIYIQSQNDGNVINNTNELGNETKIIGNKTYTTEDLGGGGIYVESDGKLTIENAYVTENKATGLGGGIAACVHGKTSIISNDGAVIHANISSGTGHIDSMSMKKAADAANLADDEYNKKLGYIDGYTKWNENQDFKDAAKDFFSAGDGTNGQGKSGAVIENQIIGGGSANWTGYSDDTKITYDNNAVIYSGNLAALTANPNESDLKKAEEVFTTSGKVFISKNESNSTHGGGIATNGVLFLGKFQKDHSNKYEGANTVILNVNKFFKGATLKDNDFSFGLYTDDNCINKIASATNKADGTVNIQVPEKDLKIDGSSYIKTFYLKEDVENSKIKDAIFDKSVYAITVTVNKKIEESKEFGSTGQKDREGNIILQKITITTYTATLTSIKQIVAADGTGIATDSQKELLAIDKSYTPLPFTNIKLTNLTVKKTVECDSNKSEDPNENQKFSITVTFGDGKGEKDSKDSEENFIYKPNGVYNFTLVDGKNAVINDIPADGTVFYVVTESNSMPEGYKLVSYSLSNGEYKTEGNKFAGDNTVTVTNRYFKTKKIDYNVEKKWVSADGINPVRPSSIMVQLSRDEDSDFEPKTIELTAANDWKGSFKDLDKYDANENEYKYSVKEIAVTYDSNTEAELLNYLKEQGINVDELIVKNENGLFKIFGTVDAENGEYKNLGTWIQSQEVKEAANNESANEAKKVVITNTWTPVINGSLKVKKTVKGLTEDEFNELNSDFTFTFKVTGPSSLNGEKEITIKKDQFKVSKSLEDGTVEITGESDVLPDLIPGKYTITEITDNVQIKDHALAVNEDEVTVQPSYTAESEIQPVCAEITNNYANNSLIIRKDVVVNGNDKDKAAEIMSKTFHFNIIDNNGKIVEENITVEAGKEFTIKGLPGNITYQIVEIGADVDGYKLATTFESSNSDGNKDTTSYIRFSHGGNAHITVTNTYDPTSLTIKKDVTGGPASASTDKEYVFTVTNENGYNETVTIKGTGETTLEGLLPGTYTITEQDARIGGYRWSTTVSVNGGNAVEGVSVPVVLENPGDDAVVVVNNNYRRIPSDDPPSDPTPSNPTTPTTPTTPEEPTTPVVDVPDPDTPLVDVPEPDVPLTNLPEEPDTPLSELPEPDVPLAEIPDEETPLVELPEDIPLAAMPPEEVPLADIIDGDVPKTGDMGLTMLWIMLCLLALSGITASSVPYLRRRRK